MSKWLVAVLVAVAFGLGSIVGVLGYNRFVGGNDEPSQPAEDVIERLSLDDPTPTPADFWERESEALATQVADLTTINEDQAAEIAALNATLAAMPEQSVGEDTEDTDASASVPEVTSTPVPAEALPTEEPLPAETTAENAADDRRALFTIMPEDSEARFKIDETLMGDPITVVGVTDDMAGDIIINYDNPAASQLGQIAVNARTLKTDNEYRNDAIRGQILQSSRDEFEFIIFTPTAIRNLSNEPLAPGETVTFQVDGDLLIRGETRPVTFDVTVEINAETEIQGLAVVEVDYSDWGITIRTPPSVSDVGETVILELDFVARVAEDEGE